MKQQKLPHIFILIFLIIGCEQEKLLERNFPVVKTHEVTDITSNGAIFTGEILHKGNSKITEVGFVWDDYLEPNLEEDDHYIIKNEGGLQSVFTAEITSTLVQNNYYYVKAFAKNEEGYTYYGEQVFFKSLGSKGLK